MNNNYLYFKTSDGYSIPYKEWRVENPRGIILIIHGMAEHIERYDSFSKYLNNLNFTVFGADIRGHGNNRGIKGLFSLNNGWRRVIKDQLEFYTFLEKTNPQLPLSIFSHSMGSFICKHILTGVTPEKVVFSGSGHIPQLKGTLSIILASVISFFKGKKSQGIFLDKIVNEPFMDSIENPSTKFDWLSRDKKEVSKYIYDTECGFICTNSFYKDLFKLATYGSRRSTFTKYSKETKFLFYSGDKDPVGGKEASEVKKAVSIFKELGLDAELKINPGGRHESINEINKDEVFSAIGEFLTK